MTSSSSNTTTSSLMQSGPIDIIKHRGLYMGISALLLIPGLVFIVLSMMNSSNFSPLRLGIDFTGGTILEYLFDKQLTQSDLPAIREAFESHGYTNPVIQIQTPRTELAQKLTSELSANEFIEEAIAEKNEEKPVKDSVLNTAETSQPLEKEDSLVSLVSIRSKQLAKNDHQLIEAALKEQFGSLTLMQKNSIGPTLASELLVNGLLALVFAYVLIVGYLTFRFQWDFAVCAIVALLHDTLFVVGVFAALGFLFNVEIDSMFVTAILTVIGFSVHDTIVVFDRLRENARLLYSKKLPFAEIANISVNQTLARSINTSVTTLLPLVTLYFFGGETTKNFVLAIVLGVLIGTYSSICVASLVLAWWREQSDKAPQGAAIAA